MDIQRWTAKCQFDVYQLECKESVLFVFYCNLHTNLYISSLHKLEYFTNLFDIDI